MNKREKTKQVLVEDFAKTINEQEEKKDVIFSIVCKKRAYLSGGISGVKNYRESFAVAEKLLIEAGYEVENPASYDFADDICWAVAMKYDLKRMLECDGLAMLDGWQKSRGAAFENYIAHNMNMVAKSVSEWVKNA